MGQNEIPPPLRPHSSDLLEGDSTSEDEFWLGLTTDLWRNSTLRLLPFPTTGNPICSQYGTDRLRFWELGLLATCRKGSSPRRVGCAESGDTTTEGTFPRWFSRMGLKLASDISTEKREKRIKPNSVPSGQERREIQPCRRRNPVSAVTRCTSRAMRHRCEWQDSPERRGLESNWTGCSGKARFGSGSSKRTRPYVSASQSRQPTKGPEGTARDVEGDAPALCFSLFGAKRPLLPTVGHRCPPLPKYLSTILSYLPEES